MSRVRKSALLCLFVFLFASLLLPTISQSPQRRRKMLALDIEDEEQPTKPKKQMAPVSKNQTKTLKTTPPTSTKSSNTSTISKTTTFKKLNSTSKATKLDSTNPIKKPLDLNKPSIPKNKTQSIEKKPTSQIKKNSTTSTTTTIKAQPISKPTPKKIFEPKFSQFDDEDADDDLISDFRDLPTKFQKQLIPDITRISKTSRAYITQANKEISEGFRPLVGKQYAPAIASVISCIFIFIPLLLVSLIINRVKTYFSLQKILIFIQVYLSIYFSILSFASLATGLEPLRFFFASSQSSYICLQVLQTLGYVLYLLLLLMYFILVFSTDTGLGLKILGFAQTVVGFGIGLHYYVSVFHRAVLHQPPKTNWKIHGIYAACFLVICLLANAERRKKAYLEEGGEEGKKS